jgi:hypothetical protein
VEKQLTEIIEQADILYANRSEIENVQLSVELLKDLAPPTYDAAWRLGRAQFFLGQEVEATIKKRTHHEEGTIACAGAVKMRPDAVEGHFWLGVNLALMAELENPLLALRHVLQAKRALRRAIQIDPAYHGAGPVRVLGRLQHKLPRVLGGSYKRARVNFERAMQLVPENTITRVYFAELLMALSELSSAREQLEAILRVPTTPEWDFEIKRDTKLAQDKLTRMEERVN